MTASLGGRTAPTRITASIRTCPHPADPQASGPQTREALLP